MAIVRADTGNEILSLLPDQEYAVIAPYLTLVTLTRGDRLGEVGLPIDHVYFPLSGIESVVMSIPGEKRSEAGLFGRDGFVPTTAASGAPNHSYDIIVQVEGEALRMAYADYRLCMDTLDAFPRLMHLAHEAFSVQVSYTAVTNTVQGVERRLARWILMCHDRMADDKIPITHDFLAVMLGVRRPSVTTSLHVLEGLGMIRSDRKAIVIRNRPALEAFAHDLYGQPEARHDELLEEFTPGEDLATAESRY